MSFPTWCADRKIFNGWLSAIPLRDRVCSDPDCGSEFFLTVDHVVAQSRDRKLINDPGNWQILCRSCNSRKNDKPDKRWQENKFDIVLTKPQKKSLASRPQQLRLAEGMKAASVFADWFSQPFSRVCGMIYVIAWHTGSGKTVGILCLIIGLNKIRRERLGTAYRRVKRILVLTPYDQYRRQLVQDLKEDAIKVLGLNPKSVPTVVAASKIDQFIDGAKYKQVHSADIVVTCVATLNDQEPETLQRIFSDFDLIVSDEAHFATRRLSEFARLATNSLVFATTATPIDSKGVPLSNMVCVDTWTKTEADRQYTTKAAFVDPENLGYRLN